MSGPVRSNYRNTIRNNPRNVQKAIDCLKCSYVAGTTSCVIFLSVQELLVIPRAYTEPVETSYTIPLVQCSWSDQQCIVATYCSVHCSNTHGHDNHYEAHPRMRITTCVVRLRSNYRNSLLQFCTKRFSNRIVHSNLIYTKNRAVQFRHASATITHQAWLHLNARRCSSIRCQTPCLHEVHLFDRALHIQFNLDTVREATGIRAFGERSFEHHPFLLSHKCV